MKPCADCDYEAKSNSGLAAHRRAKHPAPEVASVEAAVRRDLESVSGSEGLQASAVALAARIDESTSARDLPALAAELRATLTLLGVGVQEEERETLVDQLASRRRARIAAASDPSRPAAGK